MNTSVQFVSKILFPETNALIFRELFEYEQLFRRLAHAALVAKAGVQWAGSLPTALLPELKKRLNNLRNRIDLNCENNRNLIWITTMKELRTILTMDSTWSIVGEFSGCQKTFLESKLPEAIEIRNVIGHNRATTPDTMAVWRGNQDIHDLADFLKGGALERTHVYEIVPRFDKGLGSFILKLGSQPIDIDACPGKLRQHLFAIASVRRQDGVYFAIIGQGSQSAFRHSVHRERRSEGLDGEDVRRLRILGSSAGP
jgi:hypothetical protein